MATDTRQPASASGHSPAAPARPPRIAHLIASNFAGGPEKQILGLSGALAAAGWRSLIGSFREGRPQVELLEAARRQGHPTFLIDTRSPYSPLAALQLRRVLRRQAIDVLVTHGYKANLVGFLANRRPRRVQLPILRGYTAENAKLRLYEALDRRLLRRFPRLLCVSAATRRLALGFGLPAERVTVLRNAIAPPRQVVPLDLRTTYRLVPTARLIVAAGRLSPEKGHRHLLAALALLRDEQPPVCLVLLGAGQAQGRLAAQIERAGLADRVRFAGFQREILPHLAGADLLVHPSLSEGLPNVLLEAFAVQCPVVATDVGGVPELVVPGETGRLVPPADPQSLAAAIREALAHPEATRTMAAAGRQRILADFSFQQQAAQFIDICAAALAAGPAGRSSPGPCDRFARARQPQSSAGRRQDPAAGPQAWLRMEVDR